MLQFSIVGPKYVSKRFIDMDFGNFTSWNNLNSNMKLIMFLLQTPTLLHLNFMLFHTLA